MRKQTVAVVGCTMIVTRTLPRWAILHKNAELISYCEAEWQPVQLNEAQGYMFMSSEVETQNSFTDRFTLVNLYVKTAMLDKYLTISHKRCKIGINIIMER